MDDREFDLELEKLLSDERKKEPYGTESIKKELLAVVVSFYDHYRSLSEFEASASADDFLAKLLETHGENADDAEEFDSDLLGELDELIQSDLEKYPILLEGELSVKGEGIYMYDVDNDVDQPGTEVEILEEGMTLTGEIQQYAVLPMISYEAFMRMQSADSYEHLDQDDIVGEMPGLWVLLRNVTVRDEVGSDVYSHEQALVPLNYPSLTLEKIVRYSDSVAELASAEQEMEPIEVAAHFKSDFILELCNEIENDINYNEYTTSELRAAREDYQAELGIYMSMVDREEELVISVMNAIMMTGDQTSFTNQIARYSDPILMKVNDSWRVAHGFEMDTHEGIHVVHILPEHLLEIKRRNEK